MNNPITKYCTGCRACELSCPKGCISMIPDKEGFTTALIDTNLCINCGLCAKLCPQNKNIENYQTLQTYAATYENNDELLNSASGGAFTGFANYILNMNGIVYGASYLDNWSVGHIRVDNKNDLFKLQGSKYVQSDTLNTYKNVKTDLENNINVLYSGTPCQIGGLRSFLRKNYSNLITIDLICHGVPSPLLFKKYIKYLSNKYKEEVLSYNFRDKTEGWGLGYKTKTKTKTRTRAALMDPYYYHFLKGNTYRECCYQCKYCTPQRVSDITIGDFWGIEYTHPEAFSHKGVSAILINTHNGYNFFKDCCKNFIITQSTFENVAKYNANLYKPTFRPSKRDGIYKGLLNNDVNFFFKTNMSFHIPLKRRFLNIMPISIKYIINNIFRYITKWNRYFF